MNDGKKTLPPDALEDSYRKSDARVRQRDQARLAAAFASLTASALVVDGPVVKVARPELVIPFKGMSSRITPSRHRTAGRRRDQRAARRVRMARKQRRGWA